MTNPLILHVNYVEQGQTLQEMCTKAVEWGFDGVEFRRTRAGVQETVEEYLDGIALSIQTSGLKYVLFGFPGPNLMIGNEDQLRQEIAHSINFYREALKRFPLTICNMACGGLINEKESLERPAYEKHGSFIAEERHWRNAVDGLRRLGDFAAEHDFRFGLETHMCYLHDTSRATLELVQRVSHPAVGVNLDYGNEIYFPDPSPVEEVVANLGDHLIYVHLKNSIQVHGTRVPCALEEGQINHRTYLRALKNNGYAGPICLESPRPGDREWFAKKDAAYLKTILEEVERRGAPVPSFANSHE